MSTPVESSSFNVIIADDHPVFRKGLASTLENIPFINSIAEASDGSEVLELLKNGKYDLVLLDINMTGMDGKTAAGHIHTQYPDTKIIAISMIDETSTIRQMYRLGCHGYLVKNADESDIIKAIEVVMEGKKYFTDDIINKFSQEPEEDNYGKLPLESSLSGIEIMLIKLICEGKSNKQIADELKYATRTVEKYRERLYEKINVANTADLVRFAVKNKIINT